MFREIPVIARAPCHKPNHTDFEKRSVGCQSGCKKYQDYMAKPDATNEVKRQNAIGASFAADNIYRKRSALKHTEAGRAALAQR